jgi:Ser/Thr protein kinase RdoA (MazF antagonist)
VPDPSPHLFGDATRPEPFGDATRPEPFGDATRPEPFGDVTRLTPSAAVTAADAAEAVEHSFGLTGDLDRLPGEADDNFALQAGDGQRYVVKVAHAQADPAVVGLQVLVLRHLASVAPELPVPRVAPAVDGQPLAVVAAGALQGRLIHVLTYLDGQLLRSVPASAALRHGIGATLASLGTALREFAAPRTDCLAASDADCLADPLADRPLLWDIAQLPRLRPLVTELPPGPDAALLDELIGRFTTEVAPRLAAQRRQLVHNDFSPDNLLISADASRVCGIIDFGDLTVTALVNDVAVAAANLLGDGPDFLGPAADLISGYHAATPLTADELDLLPELMLARIVARLVISQWRAVRFPANRAYILRNTSRAHEQLSQLRTIGVDEITARVRDAGRPEDAFTPEEWHA